jgi:6-phospho-beta-glucosidase
MGQAGKLVVLGGGSARTPLLIHGIAEARERIGVEEIALYDIDTPRVKLIASLGAEVVRRAGSKLKITVSKSVEDAVSGAQYVISSLRVGGSAARARDEYVARRNGFVGQETTGPGGMAMALRTIPVTLEYARVVERYAPDAWFINFTNPAGLITQALTSNIKLRVVGICDTPTEIFHNIAKVLKEPQEEVICNYSGLNHLGWVHSVKVRGQERIEEILQNDSAIQQLYPSSLFAPALLRSLKAIPTEYLFFYYSQKRAFQNQSGAGATRGAELEKLDREVFGETTAAVAAGNAARALDRHAEYLMQRSASYLRLEARGESAMGVAAAEFPDPDPFHSATGYHRMALEVMTALAGSKPSRVVVNVPNGNSIPDLEADDVVEVPCQISSKGVTPMQVGRLPQAVRGLVLSVKEYERLVIQAAIQGSADLARAALLALPIVGDWEAADQLIAALIQSDPEYLGYLKWKGP